MTVPIQDPIVSQVGNGVTTSFPFDFAVLDSADLNVELAGSPATIGAQYTIDGIGNPAGGAVNFITAPAVGQIVLIYREIALKRDTDYQDNGDLLASAVNADLDRIWMALQDTGASGTRSLRYPIEEFDSDGTLPAAGERAGMVLGFDSIGNLEVIPPPATVGAGDLHTDVFVVNVDFTPDVTTELTMSRAPGKADNAFVWFDATPQLDGFTVTGNKIDFSTPLPDGVDKVFIRTGTTISGSVPPAGSVDATALAPRAVGDGQIDWAGASLVKVVSTLTALRALSSSIYARAYLDTPTQAGTYALQATDTTSPDNGVTIIVSADGGRWHLADGNMLTATHAGARGDGATDDTTALALAEALGDQVYLHDGFFPSTAKRKSYRYVGPGVIKVNGVVQPTAKLGAVIVGGNFLPNCQWQLWGDVVGGSIPIQKQNQAGTGNQATMNCTGFTTTTATPTFLTPNTGQLKVGDLVQITGGGFQWGYAGVGYINTPTAVRVIAVTPNTSFQVAGPLGGAGVSPAASAAVLAAPICAGDLGAVGLGPDGWTKTTSLNIWADDFVANQCPGSIRTLGIRKGSAAAEVFSWQCPAGKLAKYLGRTVTFGVLVRQSVQGGAGTSSISINDSVTGSTNSIPGTGVSYADPEYGGFEFISVSAKVAANATSFQVNINLSGALGDVYYVSVPTAVFGYNLGRENLGQTPGEVIHSNAHWNPPLLTPLQITMPTAAFPGAGVLYGFAGCDLQALSFDSVDKSVARVACKVELTTPTPGASLFVANNIPAGLIFGPQPVTQVANVMNLGQAVLPLYDGGKFTFFTGQSGLVVTSATFDFDDVYA